MPNGESKKLNFVAKVWDAKANNGVGAYRPIYIAPDATDDTQGDVFLSDEANSNLDAATGMTAATPKAVSDVLNTANNKLDKISTDTQSIAGAVSFANTATFTKQVQGNGGFKGDLVGNASTATALKTARTITLDAGGASSSASFDGASNIAISLSQVDAGIVSKGVLPLSVIPQAALERLVKVADEAARFALTTGDVQLGDSVLQTDTGVMYIVVNTANLASADGYQEYKAGTAASASTAAQLSTARNFSLAGDVTAPAVSFNGTGDVALSTTIADNAVVTSKIKDSNVTSAKVNFNYAGSSSKGGAATSAAQATKLETARNFSVSGAVTSSAVSFNGTSDVSLATALADGAVATSKLADSAVTANKIASGAVTTAKIADSQVTEGKIASNAVTTAKIKDANVTTAKIADKAITVAKLGTDVGLVYVGTNTPSDTRYKLYGQKNSSGTLTDVYIYV